MKSSGRWKRSSFPPQRPGKRRKLLLEALRKDYRVLESDAKANLDLIRKSKSQLPSVKSNREYQALLKQVDESQKKNSRVEDEMLALLDRIEAGEKELEQRNQDCLSALKNRLNRKSPG